jgi:hypothetical protein
MVIGKLFSALSYVFLLIIASIPFASLVFVFGGVGPEDLIRAYTFLFALAFGMGALGLFISALVKRTQTATVATFVIVLLLTFGTAAAHQFWQMASKSSTTSVIVASKGKAPEAALWLNPFVADLDMICATAPDSYHLSCDYISSVTGRPYFGTPVVTNPGIVVPFQGPAPAPGVVIDDTNDVNVNKLRKMFANGGAAECPPNAECAEPQPGGADAAVVSFGFPRDTFWPKSAAAFVFLGVTFTLLSAQLVSPTRRFRFRRPHLPRRGNREAVAASDTAPAATVEETETTE